jgi:hypothetical protein
MKNTYTDLLHLIITRAEKEQAVRDSFPKWSEMTAIERELAEVISDHRSEDIETTLRYARMEK